METKIATESQEQCAFIDYLKVRHPLYYSLIFHVPNGGYRTKWEASSLKKNGVKSGVPDLFLPVAHPPYHGIFIEMKSKNGRLSDNQLIYCENVINQNYAVGICYGFDEAVRCLDDYCLDRFIQEKWLNIK